TRDGMHGPTATRICRGAQQPDTAHAAEVVVALGPAAHLAAVAFQRAEPLLVDARLGVDHRARRVKTRAIDGGLRLEPLAEDRAEHADQRGGQAPPARGADRKFAAV